MSKKNKETEALLEEEVQNEGIQTLADEITIPSNFNLSYFWNHYGYIEQNSFTSYIKQLEDDTDDSGSDDGDSTGDEDTEPGPEEEKD